MLLTGVWAWWIRSELFVNTGAEPEPAPAEFSSTDARQTAGFVFGFQSAIQSGNAASERLDRERFGEHVRPMRGRRIRWPIPVEQVSAEGKVSLRHVPWPQTSYEAWQHNGASDPRHLYRLVIRTKGDRGETTEWFPFAGGFEAAAKLKRGDVVVLTGTVAEIDYATDFLDVVNYRVGDELRSKATTARVAYIRDGQTSSEPKRQE
jgi:hypothetical protein